ncbi:MAG TPA: DUF4272 domain-containing protein [Flavitalea sp.]|nr:DUF4272 domain-containing protein [Flavitalea sp.]
MAKTISKLRWEKLRQRMIAYGIDDVPLTAIPLNITEVTKQPEEAAARLLLLLSIAFSASNAAETDKIADWLKTEELWLAASEVEKTFFREHETSEDKRAALSFQFEGAYMLSWALGKVKIYPDPSSECDAELVADFFSFIPPLFSETDSLFEDGRFRKVVAIHDEYLFYSMTQLYFKHIREVDKENTSNIHEAAAYQRFLVLEWLMNDVDWDEEEEE